LMKSCILIPTYNEAKEIGRLIQEIRLQGLDVLVVDDGSTDTTFQIAVKNGAIAIKNEKNEGKGASLNKGFKLALSRGYDVVITMDGDGQHLPQDIPAFLRMARDSSSPVFVGNRMNSTMNMPWVRILTNKFMSWFVSRLAGQRIPDSQCGFRLLKKEALQKLNLMTSKFEIESEMLIQAGRLGFKIESVPVTTVYSDEKSRINPFVDTLRFIRFVIKELWTTPR
jgi:glycosyltransferase involved in cell wall biosynthesis